MLVIVPLYIYPLPDSWSPLLHAARSHPKTNFLAIINPNNGPGTTPLPDANYTAILREISSSSSCYDNIHLIGYVHCSYGRRDVEAVKRDLDVYRGWAAKGGLRMKGFFVDEAPSGVGEDGECLEYTNGLVKYAKQTWLSMMNPLGSNNSSIITVLNPGVVPDKAYFSMADYIVVFEQSRASWTDKSIQHGIESLGSELRSQALAIIHTCADGDDDGMEDLVRDVRKLKLAGGYVTDQDGGGFTRWPELWERFVDAVDEEEGCS